MLLHCAVICMKCSSASSVVCASVICASIICANSFIYASSFISASSAISTDPSSFLSSFFYPSFFPITFIMFPVQNVNWNTIQFPLFFHTCTDVSFFQSISWHLVYIHWQVCPLQHPICYCSWKRLLALSFFFSVPIFLK